MSLPHEQRRAVQEAGEFLRDMLARVDTDTTGSPLRLVRSRWKIQKIPANLRVRASTILRHFPTRVEIDKRWRGEA